MSRKNTSATILQGINKLIVDATLEITDVVEETHHRILHPPFLPVTPVQRIIATITGTVYNGIRWSAKQVGNNTDVVLNKLSPYISKIPITKERAVTQAVLNGLIGDHLEKTNNPLKITMAFKNNNAVVAINKKSIEAAFPSANGSIMLMIHGSCMSDQQWTHNYHNHGMALSEAFNKTPLFVHYNTGKHVSTNGKELNSLLESLIKNWPVPVKDITIIAHSMGGLVARSAVYYGETEKQAWTKKVKKIFFLGTPHHGATLEKAGNYIEALLKAIPYAKPFAKLAKIRGAGVTDLRYGNLLDEDWLDIDQHSINGDLRTPVPLPKKITCYAVAGVAVDKKSSLLKKRFGDNLVSIKSALGQHKKASKTLQFDTNNMLVVYNCNHTMLLSNHTVYKQLQTWMA